MFAQYLDAMENMRSDNIKYEYNNWYWMIDGELSGIKTRLPSKRI